MLSEILVLPVITSNIVLSQSSDYVLGDSPATPLPYINDKTDAPEWVEETPFPSEEIPEGMPSIPAVEFPNKPAFQPNEDLTSAQEQGSADSSSSSPFLWVMLIVIVGSICIVIFWTFIGYDLIKDKQKRTENREQILADKPQELDRVGMDQGNAESAANKTVSSASSNTSKKSNSLESIRSSIGGQSSTTGASTSKSTANSVKSDTKGSKSKSISKTGPTK